MSITCSLIENFVLTINKSQFWPEIWNAVKRIIHNEVNENDDSKMEQLRILESELQPKSLLDEIILILRSENLFYASSYFTGDNNINSFNGEYIQNKARSMGRELSSNMNLLDLF